MSFSRTTGAILSLCLVGAPATGLRAQGFDVQVRAIEVTQGVRGDIPQRDRDEPLILDPSGHVHVANRRTFVRVYPWIDVDAGAVVPPLTAVLYGVRATEQLPGSPLSPLSPIVPVPGDSLVSMRADAAKGWTFELPSAWVELADDDESFSMVLAPEINPGQLQPECEGCDDNNSALLAVEFEHVRRDFVRIPGSSRIVRAPVVVQPYLVTHVCADPGGPTVRSVPTIDGFMQSLSQVRRMLPIAERARGLVLLPIINETWTSPSCTTAGQGADTTAFDTAMYSRHFPGGVRDGDPPGVFRIFFVGGALFVNGGYAFCRSSHVVTNASGLSLVHEVTHAIGFDHAGSGHCERTGLANCENAYPDSHGQVEANAFGFDTYTGVAVGPGPYPFPPPGVTLPDACQGGPAQQRTHDLMSGAAGPKWMSLYTWNRAKELLRVSETLGGGAGQLAGDYIALSGVADVNAGVRFDPLFRSGPPGGAANARTSQYRVEFLDGQGSRIYEENIRIDVPFDLDDTVPTFSNSVLAPAGWSTLRLLVGQVTIATLERSGSAPTIALTAPSAGTLWPETGETTVAWNATDPDGDPLTFRIELSADGALWFPIHEDIQTRSAQVDVEQVAAGGGEFLLRVQASDGVNVAVSESRTVRLVARAPQPYIFAPRAGEVFREGSVIRISGLAGDWQDGTVEPARLSWRLDDVVLGAGESFSLRGVGPGLHRLTLEAVNSHDLSGSHTVRFTVGDAGRQLPGDANQDGAVDISDGVALFGFLFLGGTDGLPCGDGRVQYPSNLALLDFNGDASIDISDGIAKLSWLFLGGPPHVLGADCTALSGCPAICR